MKILIHCLQSEDPMGLINRVPGPSLAGVLPLMPSGLLGGYPEEPILGRLGYRKKLAELFD